MGSTYRLLDREGGRVLLLDKLRQGNRPALLHALWALPNYPRVAEADIAGVDCDLTPVVLAFLLSAGGAVEFYPKGLWDGGTVDFAGLVEFDCYRVLRGEESVGPPMEYAAAAKQATDLREQPTIAPVQEISLAVARKAPERPTVEGLGQPPPVDPFAGWTWHDWRRESLPEGRGGDRLVIASSRKVNTWRWVDSGTWGDFGAWVDLPAFDVLHGGVAYCTGAVKGARGWFWSLRPGPRR